MSDSNDTPQSIDSRHIHVINKFNQLLEAYGISPVDVFFQLKPPHPELDEPGKYEEAKIELFVTDYKVPDEKQAAYKKIVQELGFDPTNPTQKTSCYEFAKKIEAVLQKAPSRISNSPSNLSPDEVAPTGYRVFTEITDPAIVSVADYHAWLQKQIPVLQNLKDSDGVTPFFSSVSVQQGERGGRPVFLMTLGTTRARMARFDALKAPVTGGFKEAWGDPKDPASKASTALSITRAIEHKDPSPYRELAKPEYRLQDVDLPGVSMQRGS